MLNLQLYYHAYKRLPIYIRNTIDMEQSWFIAIGILHAFYVAFRDLLLNFLSAHECTCVKVVDAFL